VHPPVIIDLQTPKPPTPKTVATAPHPLYSFTGFPKSPLQQDLQEHHVPPGRPGAQCHFGEPTIWKSFPITPPPRHISYSSFRNISSRLTYRSVSASGRPCSYDLVLYSETSLFRMTAFTNGSLFRRCIAVEPLLVFLLNDICPRFGFFLFFFPGVPPHLGFAVMGPLGGPLVTLVLCLCLPVVLHLRFSRS